MTNDKHQPDEDYEDRFGEHSLWAEELEDLSAVLELARSQLGPWLVSRHGDTTPLLALDLVSRRLRNLAGEIELPMPR